MTQGTPDQTFQSAIRSHRAGRLADAEKLYRQVLAQNPNHADALQLLGSLLGQMGQVDLSIELIRRAISINPNNAGYHNNLGNALRAKGQLDTAIASYNQALKLNPNDTAACTNIGDILKGLRRYDEAITAYRQAIRLKPDDVAAHFGLGISLHRTGKTDEAIALFRRAIQLCPTSAEAHYNLGTALEEKRLLDEAAASYQHAIDLKPDFAAAHSNLGNARLTQGLIDQALACFRTAIAMKPEFSEAHSNILQAIQCHPAYSPAKIREELHQWNQLRAEPLKKFIRPHTNTRQPDRRLRIGYVSPDFCDHVVGQNLLPLLREHDHTQFEIFCYADVMKADAMTDQCRQHADVWRVIAGLPDAQVADLIRQDQIDILVDLALHTACNRLLLFAQKPTPMQVSYLGYCGTTGLTTMDYRLSDWHFDPADSDLSLYTERTFRLPETYWCYRPKGPAPQPSPSPAATKGFITFGCLNNFAKVSIPTQQLWAQILKNVPQSRLIIYSLPGSHLKAVQDRFAAAGISPDRIEFVGWQSWPDYLQTYGRIDIALDSFPWAGGITSCDALYMGVPIVTLYGQTPVGRGGASILNNIKLPDLIARSPNEYIQIATQLSADLPRLTHLRQTLRQTMESSPLMNAPRFARNVEAAYRQMWLNWVAG